MMGCGLTVLAAWQARSLTLGALFIVAFCVAVILLQVGREGIAARFCANFPVHVHS